MTDNFDNLRYNRPSLFRPSVYRELGGENTAGSSYVLSDSTSVINTALGNSGSFRYDVLGTGIKSTQQLNVDWTDFAAHTFFNSAQVKVNVAYEKIINEYPFDGTQKEYELFMDNLTGYEKYIYDNFPKNMGYLFLSGTANTEVTGGTYVVTKDIVGAAYPDLVKVASGDSILSPVSNSMTIEFYLFLPPVSSSNQYVLNKISSSAGMWYGFSSYLSATGSTTQATLTFDIMSGSSHVSCSAVVSKNAFNHIAFVWNRIPNINSASLYVNQVLAATSSQIEIDSLNMNASDFVVGSGSATPFFTPQHTLSGALDELRIWHSIRSPDDLKQYACKNVFAADDLMLYYRFNEPSGSNTRLVLDHSGKGLHGQLSTYALTSLYVREVPTGSVAGTAPVIYERSDQNPILFPSYPMISTQRSTLLLSASYYDGVNPNLITRLIPPHYLTEGQLQDGLSTEEGSITTTLTANTDPNTAKLGETQILLYLLWTWAKYFDELKLYLDAFGNLLHVDYDSANTVPDQFLPFLANYHGITLPTLFVGTSIEQYINAENVDSIYSNSQYSMQYIQNQIWRRLLINLQDILGSKGTIHSVKAFIRTLGIDPDNNFRIREFGGPTKKALGISRDQRSEVTAMLNFDNGGYIQSAYLSGSRTEPGYPWVAGTTDDGLYTSGSWTVEGMYVLPHTNSSVQSLVRLETTGSATVNFKGIIANLVAFSGSGATLYIKPNATGSASYLTLTLSGFNPMNDQPWFFSFGKQRNDEIGATSSSSFFLRAARSSFGKILEEYTTASYFNDNAGGGPAMNALAHLTGTFNASGSFLVVGSQSLAVAPYLLNNTASVTDAYARYTGMDGKAGQIRFWSKALTTAEWREHVRNFKSLGVLDPTTNFNFVTNKTGSFGRLRLDVSCDQPVTKSDALGQIQAFDFSQNELHFSGTLFPATSSVVVPQPMYYSFISPYFDQASTTNKIRVRSYQNVDNLLNNENVYAVAAPLYELERSEEPQDNTRFTIDFSIVDALNQDMVGLFATLDLLDNALGAPELVFADEYPDLVIMREVYFNRLTDKINLKNFFEFFKWFDTNIGTFIARLVPRKTKYLGTNYVIESHMLERPKFQYQYADIYLGDNTRGSLRDYIRLQYLIGTCKRY